MDCAHSNPKNHVIVQTNKSIRRNFCFGHRGRAPWRNDIIKYIFFVLHDFFD